MDQFTWPVKNEIIGGLYRKMVKGGVMECEEERRSGEAEKMKREGDREATTTMAKRNKVRRLGGGITSC